MVENFFLWIYVPQGHTHNLKHKYVDVEQYIMIYYYYLWSWCRQRKKRMSRLLRVKILVDTFN